MILLPGIRTGHRFPVHAWMKWTAPSLLAGCLVLAGSVFLPLPAGDFGLSPVQSIRIVDRNGILLREMLNDREGRGEWRPLEAIAPAMRMATVAVEDRRFYSHPGVDIIAVGRSLVRNVFRSRRSGGSTITQQVIRNVYHRPRTVPSKCVEMWEALRLERMFSKDQILEQYLNRAPYGNQVFGVEAASRWYFGKPAADLSLAEAAFLAGLPNAPSTLNPYRNFAAAVARQHDVLSRMLRQGMIGQEEHDRAAGQRLQMIPSGIRFMAPHACLMAVAAGVEPEGGTIRTTIDEPLQEEIQWLIRGRLKRLRTRNVHNAAAIVIDNRSGEIRALVGSADFTDVAHDGQVNGVLARRQPGSAIKPFMYALTLEHGLTPASILPDIPTALPDHHGDYVPENYDRRFHGPVRLRTALACSYNVPAVRAFQTIGKQAFLDKLRDLGCEGLEKDPEYYGYGLTLGNGEVTLLELASAYRALACGGRYGPVTLVPRSGPVSPLRQVYDERAVFCITDILRDPAARRPAFGGNFSFPFQCAVKTGTTKDYKDNWTIGYTTRYTVGVWVGNFDGEEMHHVSGVSGAGPIFSDIMMYLHTPPFGDAPADFPVPGRMVRKPVCAVSGQLPTPACPRTIDEWFMQGGEPQGYCPVHRLYILSGTADGGRREVFEQFPPEYSAWAGEQGFAIPPPGAMPELTPKRRTETGARELTILSPNTGDYFAIDPVLRPEYQSIRIKGYIPEKIDSVELHINGEALPFHGNDVEWRLKKGEFRLQLSGTSAGRKINSRPVIITVE